MLHTDLFELLNKVKRIDRALIGVAALTITGLPLIIVGVIGGSSLIFFAGCGCLEIAALALIVLFPLSIRHTNTYLNACAIQAQKKAKLAVDQFNKENEGTANALHKLQLQVVLTYYTYKGPIETIESRLKEIPNLLTEKNIAAYQELLYDQRNFYNLAKKLGGNGARPLANLLSNRTYSSLLNELNKRTPPILDW